MFEIIWSEKAESEYLYTLDFWILHNKSVEYSERILIEVEKCEDKISRNPDIGTVLQYRNAKKVKVLKHFSLIYRLGENKIEILSFWDNRRNPDDLKI